MKQKKMNNTNKITKISLFTVDLFLLCRQIQNALDIMCKKMITYYISNFFDNLFEKEDSNLDNVSERCAIFFSKNISNAKLNAIKEQLAQTPKFWRKRFLEDNWQILLDEKLPEEFGGNLGELGASNITRKIWLNINSPTFSSIIYKAFACYVSMTYGYVTQYKPFIEVSSNEEQAINQFMHLKGYEEFKEWEIFVQIFAHVIETKGLNKNKNINQTYQYIKKWVYGDIFLEKPTNVLPIMKIGKYVINEQLELVIKAYWHIPRKLRENFVKYKGKLILLRDPFNEESPYAGYFSAKESTIHIRTSSTRLEHNTYHEFGHFLDYVENIISQNIEFTKIFYQEKERFREICQNEMDYVYAISDQEEYFAEAFAYYMEETPNLEYIIPKSYCFIEKIIRKWL